MAYTSTKYPQDGNMPIDNSKNITGTSSKNAGLALKERYAEVDIKNYYNPYRMKENIEPFMGGFPIIFFTTPSMNIFNEGKISDSLKAANELFSYFEGAETDLLQCLQYGFGNSPFIKVLTNRFKGMGLKDLSMKTQDEYETYYGWKQVLPGPNTDSYTADSSLIVNFSESKNLDITKLHYAWMQYIEAVRYGLHEPSSFSRKRRTIDYMSSLYFFLLDFDMSKILYYTKYTGVYPTNVPLSSLVMNDLNSKGPVDTSITYAYQYKEEFKPRIILDFNAVSKNPDKLYNFTRTRSSDGFNINTYNTYGYNPPSSDDSFNKEINFSNKKLDSVEIKTFKNKDYVSNNETGFASNVNQTRSSLHLVFSSSNDSQ